VNQDPLHCCIVHAREEAVGGQAAAGDGGEGKVGGTEDPVQGGRGGDVDPSQQADVLQPQLHCLHHSVARSQVAE